MLPKRTKSHTHTHPSLGSLTGLTYLSPDSNKPLCHYFGGIPYARTQIQDRRWRLPLQLHPEHVYEGDFTGGAGLCPQPGFLEPPDEAAFTEDCLQLNVWLPVGEMPVGGWPVFFYIHGGWLQFGTPNHNDFSALLGETALQGIFVCPAYRVNLFGFLASKELHEEAAGRGEPCGNYGFWDQRMALQWTFKKVGGFGGNRRNITVAGYSAGAHSTFYQLSHDLFPPSSANAASTTTGNNSSSSSAFTSRGPIITRAIMFSNGPGMQPKSLERAQVQFDSLLTALSIPLTLSSAEKLSRLRALPAKTLLAAVEHVPLHEFRGITDDVFISKNLFRDIDSGEYGQRMVQRDLRLMTGECADERFLYALWRSPSTQHDDSKEGLARRLEADYPAAAVKALIDETCGGNDELPTVKGIKCRTWDEAFGVLYADMQVHALERGFIAGLAKGGAADLVHRYRIEWRAECVDNAFPRSWGVTHGTDVSIWFWGNGMDEVGLRDREKAPVQKFAEPFWEFVMRGDAKGWGGQAPKGVRRLKADAEMEVWEDEDWERGLRIWKLMRDAQESERAEDERNHGRISSLSTNDDR